MEIAKRASLKQYLRQNKMRTSSGLYEAVNAAIETLLKKACLRAAANKRQTVMEQDI